VLSTVSSKDHSSCAVQYAFKFVNELLVAASEKAVAIVQPRDDKTFSKTRHFTDFSFTRSSAVAETVRHFVSLNILLSHSRSFKMTLLSRAYISPY